MAGPDGAVAGWLLAIERSATRWEVVFFQAELVVGVVCAAGVQTCALAVLAIGPVAAGLMCTTIVKVWVAPAASVPKLQVTVPAVVVQPALAAEELTSAVQTHGAVVRRQVEGTLLVTVRE